MSKKTVRGPQLALKTMDQAERARVQLETLAKLKARRVRGKVKAKGEPPRTARVRYMESPTKKDGNPFFALRIEAGLLRAFKEHAKSRKMEATAMVRAMMVKATGYKMEESESES